VLQVIYDLERSVNIVVKPSIYRKAKAGSSVITVGFPSKSSFSTLAARFVVCDNERED